jgi:UDP-N-acetylmuramoyl-L-alanyl-D-glutamate--2,6-diaminopimelate ligase
MRTMGSAIPLRDLVHGVRASVRGDDSTTVERLAWRRDQPCERSLFFCFPPHGVSEAAVGTEAVAAGAAALVVSNWLPLSVPQVRVRTVISAMGPIAAEFYHRPGDRLVMAAVTGTNGKTTVTYLLESIFSAAGLTSGVLGSIGVWLEGEQLHRPYHTGTTPEAPVVQQWLAELRDGGALAVALEATSHALHQHRLDGLRFGCAIFTNLTLDHLDYHPTMEAYFEAKARLFTPEFTERSVLNADSPESARLLRPDLPTVTYGVENAADIRATDVRMTPSGSSFRVGDLELRTPLLGMFNVSNCLAAIAAARSLGLEDEFIAEGLAEARQVPGRMEQVDVGQEFPVYVDYAHTPDGLLKVLEATRHLTQGRVVLVVSCGGDRTPERRPLVAEVATRLADVTIMTTGSPRSEDPRAIIEDMKVGAEEGRYVVELDRRTAIAQAFREARAGDTVLIVGRGPTPTQEFADHSIPFDDREVAAEELQKMVAGT